MTTYQRRVVITGMGLISPLGHSYNELWNSLSQQKSGVRPIQGIPTEHFPSDFGGECQEFTGHISNFGELEKKQVHTPSHARHHQGLEGA